MGERVRLKENGVLDEEMPTLMELAFQYFSDNLNVLYEKNPVTDLLELKDGIIIPNEICDR